MRQWQKRFVPALNAKAANACISPIQISFLSNRKTKNGSLILKCHNHLYFVNCNLKEF